MEMKERDMAGLEAKLNELEDVKDRQAGEIDSLRQSRHELDEKTSTIGHLTQQLHKVKYTLDDVTSRQREVSP